MTIPNKALLVRFREKIEVKWEEKWRIMFTFCIRSFWFSLFWECYTSFKRQKTWWLYSKNVITRWWEKCMGDFSKCSLIKCTYSWCNKFIILWTLNTQTKIFLHIRRICIRKILKVWRQNVQMKKRHYDIMV